MSGLNAQEKQLLRVASFEVSWLSGNAIAEACRMKKADLYREMEYELGSSCKIWRLTRCESRTIIKLPNKITFKLPDIGT